MNEPRLIKVAVIGLILMIVGFFCVSFTSIKGNEMGIKETWAGGVEDRVYQPGMQWRIPAWSQKIYKYDMSVQTFMMKDPTGNRDQDDEIDAPAYKVPSMEGQDMTLAINIRWRLDPLKLVAFHKTVRFEPENKLIAPVAMRVIRDEATKRRAIDAYSGEGLVSLQQAIQQDLIAHPELREAGIIVENFVIEHNELDPNYIAEIKGKQIATQRQLRAIEEQKAAEADALVAKAKAQADANTQIVGAERAKAVTILNAQASNEQAIIAARAEQQKRVLEAEGKRDADIAEAKGILAKGEAQAAANKLLMQSYATAGSEMYTRIEIAKQIGPAFSGIKGFLPADMKINLLTGNFVDSVEQMMKTVITK